MPFFQEFKSFAMRGNVVDLAVGIIIGGAFGTIVSSLVGDIIMPVIGMLTGGINFLGLSVKVGEASIAYGKFIQATLSFLIIAFSLFTVVKGMNALKKKEETVPTKEKMVSDEVRLLTEIRDLLKK
ncbi:MAG: mechanosensitive ion channel protein MscL [Candidatus Lloydbacteria bacterium RIFCSPLOWO2_01_FULL_50_20]|uniref:Large-conductance mechanosensitive channel n=1 Tax=Candidatus Lloydbacteria bacterium RIFCSPLOWO2_01_FULL_50_20 TaxID=1798665 RepID=A0A1G2DGC4_9BACT|nr:MAG: mechanosensitive ion channel protein MscL [Candidatus Lloydbacteria bacterium RIFCSPHIGHO2_02_FULL_50_11]OGZ11910.1 MAG: mechanosensitive ion channel protein MscL [Candidatus Lloydbacteria bacterium RIFCSPLOWO2_01_FULL_50_20]